ncbi:LysR substrate-binding domain-containing protein [Anderseniella sp. Alg231-50]|uniref:LysR substrate-binding domain-containing protein n=1 Tax=Anderseniella sp. Alg231-50 TaxID=1922226 RepID=UPI000D553E72
MHRLDWSDLQYILAVANHGSLAAAARALGVNHSTVQRRITSFEALQQVTVFDRKPDGYKLTIEGQQLLEAAKAVEQAVWGLERKITGKDLKLEGTIRLTTTDTLLHTIVGRPLALFHQKYPDILLDVSVTNSILSLTRRDADVAIRPAQSKPEPLVGHHVGDIQFAVYAAPAYLRDRPAPTLTGLDWLSPGDTLANTTPGRWLRRTVPKAKIVMRTDSLLALGCAAQRGLGAAMLPTYLGDELDGIERVDVAYEKFSNGLWIVTHADLANAARIHTFMEFMSEALRQEMGVAV